MCSAVIASIFAVDLIGKQPPGYDSVLAARLVVSPASDLRLANHIRHFAVVTSYCPTFLYAELVVFTWIFLPGTSSTVCCG